MESKFKVGDEVNISASTGTIMAIDLTNNDCFVNGCRVPESSLTLVEKEQEFEPGDEVEISADGKIWGNSTRTYLCKTFSGTHAAEHRDGTVSAFKYCRRPQPKMQKWNVWQCGDTMWVLKDTFNGNAGKIVHSFELPVNP